jgi:hypothetical protein
VPSLPNPVELAETRVDALPDDCFRALALATADDLEDILTEAEQMLPPNFGLIGLVAGIAATRGAQETPREAEAFNALRQRAVSSLTLLEQHHL